MYLNLMLIFKNDDVRKKHYKKRSNSPSKNTVVQPQDTTEVASSDEGEQYEEGESFEDLLRADSD